MEQPWDVSDVKLDVSAAGRGRCFSSKTPAARGAANRCAVGLSRREFYSGYLISSRASTTSAKHGALRPCISSVTWKRLSWCSTTRSPCLKSPGITSCSSVERMKKAIRQLCGYTRGLYGSSYESEINIAARHGEVIVKTPCVD